MSGHYPETWAVYVRQHNHNLSVPRWHGKADDALAAVAAYMECEPCGTPLNLTVVCVSNPTTRAQHFVMHKRTEYEVTPDIYSNR